MWCKWLKYSTRSYGRSNESFSMFFKKMKIYLNEAKEVLNLAWYPNICEKRGKKSNVVQKMYHLR